MHDRVRYRLSDPDVPHPRSFLCPVAYFLVDRQWFRVRSHIFVSGLEQTICETISTNSVRILDRVSLAKPGRPLKETMPDSSKFGPVKPCDANDVDFFDKLPIFYSRGAFYGSAGIVHSEAVLVTPGNFAELKSKIGACSSFAELVGCFQAQASVPILPRGTMLLSSKICAADAEDRDAAITACSAISDSAASALTSQMLGDAWKANRLYREDGNKKRIKEEELPLGLGRRDPERTLEDIRHDIKGCRPFSVKHLALVNVWNARGDLVATSPGGGVPVDFLDGGDADEEIEPLDFPSSFSDEVFFAALRPAQRQLQYEMFCIQLERIGRQDLIPSIVLNDIYRWGDRGCSILPDPGFPVYDIELRIPIGRTEAVEIDVGGRGGAAKSDNHPDPPAENDMWVDVTLRLDFGWFNWRASIQFAAADGVEWGSSLDDGFRHFSSAVVASCPIFPDRAILRNGDKYSSKMTNRITFASAEQCAAAVKTMNDLQSIFTPTDGAGPRFPIEAIHQDPETLVSRCPQYESTHAILSAPLEKLAFVIDMGEKSRAVDSEEFGDAEESGAIRTARGSGVPFWKTVDMVNSAEYRAYHGLGEDAKDTLQYELYVSVKD